MKKILKALLILLLVVVIAVGSLLGYLTATEFDPAAVETAEVRHLSSVGPMQAGESRTRQILTWNIGYGGLGEGSDFFMDGGTNSRSADKPTVEKYLSGMDAYLSDTLPDFIFLQEVDVDSARTFSIDERDYFLWGDTVHALNYSCPFVPIPWPPIGRVNSGLFTASQKTIDHAERIALPCPFSWPLSIANLKRCLLVSYVPIEGSDSQIVLVNLHLEAYDDGEGKIAQTRQLMDFLQSEYDKGNYVIAGGDFNQIFPGSLEVYPNTHPKWEPGVLEEASLPEGFSYVYDLSSPTCRLLNQPYDPSDTVNTQYYVIDGFIVSPNVQVDSVESVDLGFENSDHNPVLMTVTFR